MLLIVATENRRRNRAEVVELLQHGCKSRVLDRVEQILALNPERPAVVPGRPTHAVALGELGVAAELPEPSALQALMLAQRSQEATHREVGIQDQSLRSNVCKQAQKLARPVEVIKQTAAEHDIEGAVFGDVPSVVAHELQVGQRCVRLDVGAGREVRFAHLNPEHLKTHSGELDCIAALKASEVSKPIGRLVTRKDRVEHALRGQENMMRAHRHALVGLRIGAAVEPDVVRGKGCHLKTMVSAKGRTKK